MEYLTSHEVSLQELTHACTRTAVTRSRRTSMLLRKHHHCQITPYLYLEVTAAATGSGRLLRFLALKQPPQGDPPKGTPPRSKDRPGQTCCIIN